MNLYDIGKELAVINNEIISEEGVISDDLERRLDEVNLQLSEKAQGLRKWIAQIEADEAILDFELTRLARRKLVREHLRERIKTYIKKAMEANGIKKIESPYGSFTVANNPPSVEVIVPEMVPLAYTRIIPEEKLPDKALIKKDMQDGKEVAGCRLITDRTRLIIK